MAEIKYQYAYDENGKIVSINDYTKEDSRLHSYKCIGCGKELLPRAIGSKSRKAHFYHKELVDCNGETYIHKLGKLLIKRKFDNNNTFIVSYPVSKECNNYDCTLRNIKCQKDTVMETIDLKKYYDTCREEVIIEGFVADLLLTNSRDLNIPPILIEICVTHPCDVKKRNSGLKIIELTLRKEQDLIFLLSQKALEETLFKNIRKREIEFISFNRKLQVPMEVGISRYIFNPSIKENGYVAKINCRKSAFKYQKDSLVELNFVNIKNYSDDNILVPLLWMYKYKYLRRCTICKFYYAYGSEDTPICRLSRKYGKPKYPKMIDAERYRSYHPKDDIFFRSILTDYYVEEITAFPVEQKNEYRVIVAGSRSFNNYDLFKEKCDYYLSVKRNTHNIIILCGTSRTIADFIHKYSYDRSIVIEPYDADWKRYGQDAGYKSNEEMINHADALIAFWDGSGTMTGALINSAKEKGLKIAIVKY